MARGNISDLIGKALGSAVRSSVTKPIRDMVPATPKRAMSDAVTTGLDTANDYIKTYFNNGGDTQQAQAQISQPKKEEEQEPEDSTAPAQMGADNSQQDGDYAILDYMYGGSSGDDAESNYFDTDEKTYQNINSMRDEQLDILTDQAIENGVFGYNGFTNTDGMRYYDTSFTTLENNPWAYDGDAENIADSKNVQVYTLADGSQILDLSPQADRARYEFMKSIYTNPENATMLGAHLVTDENGTRYEGGYYFPPTEEGLAAFDLAYQNTFGHDAATLDQVLANGDMDRLSQMMSDDDMVYYLADQLGTTTGTEENRYRPMDNLDITDGGTTLGSLVGSDATDEDATTMAAAYLMNELVDYANEGGSDVMDYMGFGDWNNLMSNVYGIDLTRDVDQSNVHKNESEYDDSDVDFDYLESVYSEGGSLIDDEGIWRNNALSQTPQYAYRM